jgi:hypothetical protein
MVVHLVSGLACFDLASYLTLIGGAVAMVPTTLTGWREWKTRYRFGFRCAEKYEIKTADEKFAVALLALELKHGVLGYMPGRFVESAALEFDEKEFTHYDADFPHREKAETDSQREFRLLAA